MGGFWAAWSHQVKNQELTLQVEQPQLTARKADISCAISTGHIMYYRQKPIVHLTAPAFYRKFRALGPSLPPLYSPVLSTQAFDDFSFLSYRLVSFSWITVTTERYLRMRCRRSDTHFRIRQSHLHARLVLLSCPICRSSYGFCPSLEPPMLPTTSLWHGGSGALSTLLLWIEAWRTLFAVMSH